jgi:hypothetical protein
MPPHCRLSQLGPIVCTNRWANLSSRCPTPMLFSNIPLVWEILDQITQDWKREVTPFQKAVDDSTIESEKQWHVYQAFHDLQPCYLKCLFSYSMFFVALKKAYDLFYNELSALNRKPQFGIVCEEKPKPNAYIKKVWRIRDISISHIGSKSSKKIDSLAAMMWQPLVLQKDIIGSWDLDKLTFGGMKLRGRDTTGNVISESADMEIGGIPELSAECSNYLDRYDQICAGYLSTMCAKLPMTVGDIDNFEFM